MRKGISVCAAEGTILLFSENERREHGYVDRWIKPGSLFEYCGEGSKGDQKLVGYVVCVVHWQVGVYVV